MTVRTILPFGLFLLACWYIDQRWVATEPRADGGRRTAARDTTSDAETAWQAHERRVSGEQKSV